MVQAYILIQTEVGKAASVAEPIAGISGVTLAEDVTGPYDVIARVEAQTVDELGQARHRQDPGRPGHHPHPHLHGRARLSRRSTLSTAAALGVAAVVLSACSSDAVEVAVPSAASEPACASAPLLWPATVSGMPRRRHRPRLARRSRAWGDPAIIARCGVAALGPDRPTECLDRRRGRLGGRSPLSDGTRFTTFGRDPAVEVLVPKTYAPEPLLLPVFAPVAKALPANGLACR